MIDAALRQIQNQLQSLQADIRLVVAHPNIMAQHLLLPSFLETPGTLYLRLDNTPLKHTELHEDLEAALKRQMPGTPLKQVQQLVLDQWDMAEALEAFVRDLLMKFAGIRIFLIGRGLPDWIREDDNLRRQSCLIPLDPSHMLPDYLHHTVGKVLLEVHIFGRGQVLVNGRAIEDWGGDLPRALFFFLVDRGLVTRADIFQAFWPQMSIKEATNIFHVTKRKINQILGLDLTVYGSGFYRLAPHIDLVYDAALFSEAVQNSAVASDEEAEELLVGAVDIVRGDFLTSFHEASSWAEKRRHELKQTYCEALLSLAKLYEQKANPRKALGLYARAFAAYPQREDVAGSMMRLYQSEGMEADALDVYHRLRDGLAKELNISPARWVQMLAGEKPVQVSEDRSLQP